MTPLQRIREDPGEVRATLEARGFDAPLDRIIELDRVARELKSKKETLQAERNKASRGGPPSEDVKRRMREVGDQIRTIDTELAEIETELNEKVLWIPNVIDPRVPRGKDEHDNRVVRKDEPKKLDGTPRPHWEIGEALGILDIPRGTKLSGSRFYVLRGAGAALQRALISWMLDVHVAEGFTEIYPPFVTRRETLPFEKLPLRYVAYTACFRREHMSAGRDVRGIKRGHEFDKVEMVVFTTPEASRQMLDELTARAAGIVE